MHTKQNQNNEFIRRNTRYSILYAPSEIINESNESNHLNESIKELVDLEMITSFFKPIKDLKETSKKLQTDKVTLPILKDKRVSPIKFSSDKELPPFLTKESSKTLASNKFLSIVNSCNKNFKDDIEPIEHLNISKHNDKNKSNGKNDKEAKKENSDKDSSIFSSEEDIVQNLIEDMTDKNAVLSSRNLPNAIV